MYRYSENEQNEKVGLQKICWRIFLITLSMTWDYCYAKFIFLAAHLHLCKVQFYHKKHLYCIAITTPTKISTRMKLQPYRNGIKLFLSLTYTTTLIPVVVLF